jgi:hypothetical protein
MQLSHTRPVVSATFDEPNLVAAAGLIPLMALVRTAGLQKLADERMSVPTDKGANAGLKLSSLVAGMAAGADSIDDMALLRHGGMAKVFTGAYAPSTLGSFLRSFTFGHVRQVDAVASRFLLSLAEHTGLLGGGADAGPVFVDVDDTIVEVHGHAKQGAAFGYSGVRGLNALLATVSTESVAPVIAAQRLRKGSAGSPRGAARLATDTLALIRRSRLAGRDVLLRADSGFWAKKTFDRLDAAGWQFSIGVRLQAHVRAAIEQIDEQAWVTLADYPPTSIAQIAETTLGDRRLVVRRVRTLDKQGELLPTWEHFPFATNRSDALQVVEAEHRQHAVVELAIRDLKDQALAHFPSGKFTANAAWTVIAALAHNLLRWTSVLGLPGQTIRAARTLRRRLLSMPGRLTKTARRYTLHLPARWPWRDAFTEALTRIRALPATAA